MGDASHTIQCHIDPMAFQVLTQSLKPLDAVGARVICPFSPCPAVWFDTNVPGLCVQCANDQMNRHAAESCDVDRLTESLRDASRARPPFDIRIDAGDGAGSTDRDA